MVRKIRSKRVSRFARMQKGGRRRMMMIRSLEENKERESISFFKASGRPF